MLLSTDQFMAVRLVPVSHTVLDLPTRDECMNARVLSPRTCSKEMCKAEFRVPRQES